MLELLRLGRGNLGGAAWTRRCWRLRAHLGRTVPVRVVSRARRDLAPAPGPGVSPPPTPSSRPRHWPWCGSSDAPAFRPPELNVCCSICLGGPSARFPRVSADPSLPRTASLPSRKPFCHLPPSSAFVSSSLPGTDSVTCRIRPRPALLAPPTGTARTHGSSPGASSAWGGSRRTWAPPRPRGTRRSRSRCTGRARSRSGCSYTLDGQAHGVRSGRLSGPNNPPGGISAPTAGRRVEAACGVQISRKDCVSSRP